VYTVYIKSKKKLRKQTIFNINTHFMIRIIMLNFKLLLQLYHKETTSDHEIKKHIQQKIRKTVQEVRFPMPYT